MEKISSDLLLNNNDQQSLQLLTNYERIERAYLCSFEVIPQEIQNQIACDMLADFFIVPQRILSDNQNIQSIAMYGDTIVTSHMIYNKDRDLFARPKIEVRVSHIDGTLLWRLVDFEGSLKISLGKDKLCIAEYNEVVVFDLCTGKFLDSFDHGSIIQSLTFDGNQVVTVSPSKINIWDMCDGKLLRSATNPKKGKRYNFLSKFLIEVSGFKIHSGKVVNISKNSIIAQIWNMDTGKLDRILEGHTDKIIRFAVDSNKVVTQSCDNVTKVWDIHTGKLLHTLMCSCRGPMVVSGDRLIAQPFDSSGINMWTLSADCNEPEFKTSTHALFWIKNNVLPLQAHLIARAYEKAQTKNPLVIYSNTQDACIWVTFPAHVREYLMKRLGIFITNKMPGTFFISKDAQVLNIIINFLTMATGITVWPPYIDDCDLPEFKNSDHALFWIKNCMKTDVADLIARAYAKSQEKEPFIIKFGSDDAYVWVKVPEHVRAYLRNYLDIKYTLK